MQVSDILRETTVAYEVMWPPEVLTPLVLDSPHSWRAYPEGFAPICENKHLLTSWDAWVDELFGAAPGIGAPLLRARFPRFFLDPNRARDDIDPELVDGDLPFALKPTEKTAKGFGLLRRNALPDVQVYDAPIPAKELLENIETYYDPYHAKLGHLLDEALARFGRAVHLNCHSMKSRGNAMNDDNGALRPDVVVSDYFGTTADSALTQRLAELFNEVGLNTQVNDPYKGAELIRRHGKPAEKRHSLQIEINRALYMHEASFEKSANFQALQKQIDEVLRAFVKEI